MLEKKMKTMSIVVVAGLVLALAPLANANMITNGGFEGSDGKPVTGWTLITNGYGAYDGGTFFTPHAGTYALHPGSSFGAGGFFQDVTTAVNTAYKLTFYAVGWPLPSPATQNGIVQVGDPGTNDNSLADSVDNELVDVMFAAPAYANAASWTELSYEFTAASTTTRIAFQNIGGGHGINIDSASLEVVPEPATMSLLALGGLGVLLRRRSRKA